MKNKFINLLAVSVLTVGFVGPIFAQDTADDNPDTEQIPPANEGNQPAPQESSTAPSQPTSETTTKPNNDGVEGESKETTVANTTIESTQETTIQTVETTVTTVVSQPQPQPTPNPIPTQPYIPSRPQPSNRPEDFEVIEIPETTVEVEEAEVEEEIDLFEGEFITFNANVFKDESEADDFIQMIEEDEATKDRFIAEKEIVDEDFIFVRVNYAKDVEEEGRYILFYISSEFETEEEAEEYLEKQLLIYPDLFVAGEMIKIDDRFDIILGIRPGTETQAVTYDEDTFEVQYEADREEYQYIVKADELTGEFIDEIQMAVEEAFPGEFSFSEEVISDTEKEVTMTPLEKEQEASNQDMENGLEEQEETTTEN
ncbi:hypothetical protein [Facklamia sp. 7083-14-GEN3]|uniref:hypothetical protein n=1 Tax=Facklamia sp. 7083-14-GEN3 TaxID=2973478 RepID=UPI00215BABF8|nr:hypothetical protein [Facklamia sp. 7083-14-GEN3]MCR8969819.1 hypothetical protein [Facklamia sp. 7083-14-GEN3]